MKHPKGTWCWCTGAFTPVFGPQYWYTIVLKIGHDKQWNCDAFDQKSMEKNVFGKFQQVFCVSNVEYFCF
jgi:hypothetical protein